MFKIFAVIVNLTTQQAQSVIDPKIYASFELCTAAIVEKYASTKPIMTNIAEHKTLIAMGCASFNDQSRGA
jgi:hypothetical protein